MGQPIILRPAELIYDLVAEHEAALVAAKSGQSAFPTTGFGPLDCELGGRFHPGIHILQAAPGIGKTALGLQVATMTGHPSIFVTAETAPVELFRRIIARVASTPLADLKDPAAMDGDMLLCLAELTAEQVPGLVIVDATIAYAGAGFIKETIEKVRLEHDFLPLIVVDSLQVWARSNPNTRGALTDYEVISFAVENLREIALALGSAVLAVSHRNRAGQQHGGLFASKGSGDIEYVAESVLELNRNPNSRPDGMGEVRVELTVLKNRHGLAGTRFDMRFQRQLPIVPTGRQGEWEMKAFDLAERPLVAPVPVPAAARRRLARSA